MERDDRTTARRVLLATIGSAGDVHPLLGLGRALRRRGHPVTLLASPVFETRARRLGLDVIPLGQFTGRRAAAVERLLGSAAVAERCRALAARCDGEAALAETSRLIETVGAAGYDTSRSGATRSGG